MTITLDGYHKRFDPDHNYDKILFRSGRGLQSTELNDLQEQVTNQVHKVSDTLLADGDVLKGGDLIIDTGTGVTQIGESSVYLRGYVREVEAREITIPVTGVFYIGVWLTEAVITELDDPGLRDPAPTARNYQEPGAARLQISHEWGLQNDDHTGTFYPVYRIENAVHIITEPPPELEAITVALARYDRESNGGSYVVEGMESIGCGYLDDLEVISISEGKAHIEGFTVQFPTALRKTFPVDPDLRTIENEAKKFEPDADGNMRYNTSYSPVHDIREVTITRSVTEDVTRAAVDDNLDPLVNSAIAIVSVQLGETTYVEGTDYQLTNDRVDWSPGGDKPSSGSSYTVTYESMTDVDPVDVDSTGFTVSGAITDTLVIVEYQWKMPRIDILTLDKEGVTRRIKGIPHPHQPRAPRKPGDQLALAEIYQTWDETQDLEITNNAIRTISMSDLKAMQDQIGDLFDLVTFEQLRNDANAQDPAAKRGVFVDPFLDDDMRDQGEDQTAAIVDGELLMPVDVEVLDLENESEEENQRLDRLQTLDYELESIINQPMHTGSMAVNPYQAFEPIPAKATLYPQVDRWTVFGGYRWSSPITRRFSRGSRWALRKRTTRRSFNQVLGWRTVGRVQFLRQRSVSFKVLNFGPGESLSQILFDGITVNPA